MKYRPAAVRVVLSAELLGATNESGSIQTIEAPAEAFLMPYSIARRGGWWDWPRKNKEADGMNASHAAEWSREVLIDDAERERLVRQALHECGYLTTRELETVIDEILGERFIPGIHRMDLLRTLMGMERRGEIAHDDLVGRKDQKNKMWHLVGIKEAV